MILRDTVFISPVTGRVYDISLDGKATRIPGLQATIVGDLSAWDEPEMMAELAYWKKQLATR